MRIFVPDPTDHMIFNIDAHVGQGCTNKSDDVFLVQFLMRKAGEKKPVDRPDIRARLVKVPLSGTVDPLTVDGIKAAQEAMRAKRPTTVVDGIVSPARGVDYGGGIWVIVTLNDSVRTSFPDKWPRLQDFSDCPEPLKTKVLQIL